MSSGKSHYSALPSLIHNDEALTSTAAPETTATKYRITLTNFAGTKGQALLTTWQEVFLMPLFNNCTYDSNKGTEPLIEANQVFSELI